MTQSTRCRVESTASSCTATDSAHVEIETGSIRERSLFPEDHGRVKGLDELGLEAGLEEGVLAEGSIPEARPMGIAQSLQNSARKFYSTTSSVYAENTISNPNIEHLLFWYVRRFHFIESCD